MNDLTTDLDKLEDNRLDYVVARSQVNSDAEGYRNAGIAKATFYSWSKEERENLNQLAQKFKRAAATRALMIIQEAAPKAAEVKVKGLESRNERVKQDVSTEILDRVIGKPTQTIRNDVTSGGEIIRVTIKGEDGD